VEALELLVGGGQDWAFWASRDYWEDVKIMDESEAEQRKREKSSSASKSCQVYT